MRKEELNGPQMSLLNLIVFVLSVYVLCALLVDTVVQLPRENSLLTYIDHVICAFFFVKFCVRFYQATCALVEELLTKLFNHAKNS